MGSLTPVFLLSFYLGITSCIHLTHHYSVAVQLQQLLSSQQAIRKQLNKISENNKNTDDSLKETAETDEQIQILEKAINTYEKSMENIGGALLYALNQSKWSCDSLTKEEKKQINNKMALMQKDLDKLREDIVSLSDTQHNNPIVSDIDHIDDELAVSISDLYAIPNEVPSGEGQLVSSLSDARWMLGDYTIKQLNKQFLDKSGRQLCSKQKPYFDGQKCIQCLKQEQKYFDMSKKQCAFCINFNASKHACEDKLGINLNAGGDRIILPDDKKLSEITGDIMCSESAPFFNGEKCIDCTDDTPLFQYASSSCSNCPSTQIYSSVSHKCEKQIQQVTNVQSQNALNRIILKQPQSLSQITNEKQKLAQTYVVEACPISTPFFNGKQCMNCDQFFDYENKSCTSCNQFYNPANHFCQDWIYLSNLQGQWVTTLKTPLQVKNQIKNMQEQPGTKQCPLQKPFSVNNNCIKCGQVFDMDSNKCIACGEGNYYSLNLHTCRQKSPYVTQTAPKKAENLILNGKALEEWISTYQQNKSDNPDIADCPKDEPFWEMYSCIDCPSDAPYFNLLYSICSSCPTSAPYDKDKRECVSQNGMITDQKQMVKNMVSGILS